MPELWQLSHGRARREATEVGRSMRVDCQRAQEAANNGLSCGEPPPRWRSRPPPVESIRSDAQSGRHEQWAGNDTRQGVNAGFSIMTS